MITKLGRPYAESFLASLGSTGAAQDALAQLKALEEALGAVPGLSAMAANPAIPLEVKQKTMGEVGDSLGLSQSVRRLVELLLENSRVVNLPEIVAAFEELLNRKLGVVKASVTSATELDDGQRQELANALRDIAGTKVEFDLSVDPNLLGGFVAMVGSRRYDTSVKGQLERMAKEMASGGASSDSSTDSTSADSSSADMH